MFPSMWFFKKRELTEQELYQQELKRRAKMKEEAEAKLCMLRPLRAEDLTTGSKSWIAAKGEKTTFVISSIEELPGDVKDSISRLNFSEDVLTQNFKILLNVLSLADKCRPRRKFLPVEDYHLTKQPHYDKATANNLQQNRFILAREELYEDTTLSLIKKDYKLLKHVGSGSYGVVFSAKVLNKKLNHSGKFYMSAASIAKSFLEVKSPLKCNHSCRLLKNPWMWSVVF